MIFRPIYHRLIRNPQAFCEGLLQFGSFAFQISSEVDRYVHFQSNLEDRLPDIFGSRTEPSFRDRQDNRQPSDNSYLSQREEQRAIGGHIALLQSGGFRLATQTLHAGQQFLPSCSKYNICALISAITYVA